MATTNFDSISTEYAELMEQPWIKYIDLHTLLNILGNIEGKSIMDLGCGEGTFARLLMNQGAAAVFGVDLSANMIEIAREFEIERPLGIEYACQDISQLKLEGKRFDKVVCDYVLSLAHTQENLLKMCQSAYFNLNPGGSFCIADDNMELPAHLYPLTEKYGFSKRIDGPLIEGAPIHFRLPLGASVIEVEETYLSRTSWEMALRKSGFKQIIWRPPQVSPEGLLFRDAEYWRDFIEAPLSVYVEAIK